MTRATSPARPSSTWPPPASRTPATSARRRSSTSSTRCASSTSRTRASTTSTRSRAGGTPAARRSGGNLGYKVPFKGGYFPVPPVDHYADLRDDMVTNLTNAGFKLERGHHEVGTAGQAEINYRFNTLLHAADDLMLFKYIVKNTAWHAGKTVTFMPKPLFGDNGSGMHAHQSLWKDGQPLFHDESGYGGLSDMAPLLHRRPAAPRAEPAGVHQPDGELLPPPGAGLRGAGQPGVLGRATARRASASRSRATTRRPSASSSAAPTRRATRTWRSPR